MRLIDADELPHNQTIFGEDDYAIGYECGRESVINEINEAPTVDAIPVMHGNWTYKRPLENGAPVVECSRCGIMFCDIINNHMFMYHYCPNCGAKMSMDETEKTYE